VTTRIWPVGSIGLQKLWPEIVLKRERESEREGETKKDKKKNRFAKTSN